MSPFAYVPLCLSLSISLLLGCNCELEYAIRITVASLYVSVSYIHISMLRGVFLTVYLSVSFSRTEVGSFRVSVQPGEVYAEHDCSSLRLLSGSFR